MDEHVRFHWSEAAKYANEGIKGIFLINGGGALSILTFIGNKAVAGPLPIAPFAVAMICFAVGALCAPVVYAAGFASEVQHLNAAAGRQARSGLTHGLTYGFAALGLLLFVAGMLSASYGFMSLPRPG